MFSVALASAWMHDLSGLTHPLFALWVLTFVAFVPGFMNAFLATSPLLEGLGSYGRVHSVVEFLILVAESRALRGCAVSRSLRSMVNREGKDPAYRPTRTEVFRHSPSKALRLEHVTWCPSLVPRL